MKKSLTILVIVAVLPIGNTAFASAPKAAAWGGSGVSSTIGLC